MTRYSVGQPVTQVEAPRLVSGRGRFTGADYQADGLGVVRGVLHGVVRGVVPDLGRFQLASVVVAT